MIRPVCRKTSEALAEGQCTAPAAADLMETALSTHSSISPRNGCLLKQASTARVDRITKKKKEARRRFIAVRHPPIPNPQQMRRLYFLEAIKDNIDFGVVLSI